MFRSLRSRLLWLMTALVILIVAPVALTSGQLLRASSEKENTKELRRAVLTLAQLYEDQATTGGAGAVSQQLSGERLRRLTDADLFFQPTNAAQQDLIDLPEPEGADIDPRELENGTATAVSWTGEGDSERVGYATLVVVDGRQLGTLVAARDETTITGRWRELAFQVSLTLVVALVGAWLVALALSRRITRPLHQLAVATRDISRGRFNSQALESVDGDDEIGELAAAFRDMAGQLREVDARDRRFLMSISHELRTPLTAIDGHAQALQDGLADDAEMRGRSLTVIRREATRLERLVEDIIDLARLRSNRFNTVTETVRLDELGEHLMAIFEDRTKHPEIRLTGSFEEVSFNSDGSRILQILRNLVSNALRYAQSEIVVTGKREKNHIRLRVVNDGEPIEPAMRERIFEPFVGKKREGGMGLGLAIGRELAWALGGNLRNMPRDDGAEFELTLPLEPPGSGR